MGLPSASGFHPAADTDQVLAHDKDGVSIRCDRCGSRLIIAANDMQPSARRMPSGWLQVNDGAHNCPLCAPAALSVFRARR